MFDANYYLGKKQKLTLKEQENIQRLIQAAFAFVREQEDLLERFNELSLQEAESKKATEKNKDKKDAKKDI